MASRGQGGRHILNRGKGLPAASVPQISGLLAALSLQHQQQQHMSNTWTSTRKIAPKSKRYGEVISRTFWSWQLEFPEQRMHQPAGNIIIRQIQLQQQQQQQQHIWLTIWDVLDLCRKLDTLFSVNGWRQPLPVAITSAASDAHGTWLMAHSSSF